ncbi:MULTISPECIES: hypothetical protein [unclassified Streptomyces]|uniref:hypothetical protein n=1 Tax=unclassified Streptomyces TaxID=2593676 RepID=UPI003866C706
MKPWAPAAPLCPKASGPTAGCRVKPSAKRSASAVTRSTPGVCGFAHSARVSGFSSGARPSTPPMAAAYIPAMPRAVPMPPAEVHNGS